MTWFENKRVVVPIDFGKHSILAVDTALEIASRPQDVHVVFVAPELETMSPEMVWQGITDETRRTNIEESFAKEFGDPKYRDVTFHVKFGDPGHGIVEHAEEVEADVIVMPSHGRTGIKRLLIGSVAERVIRLAHCPVLVLR